MARSKVSPPVTLRREPTSFSLKEKVSGLIVPLLVTLLVVMAFGIGILVTKVQYLEGKSGTPAAPLVAQPQAQPTAPSLTADQFQQLASKGFAKGNPNAKVTFIEFADYQCPYCERFFTQVEAQLIKDYVDSGKVHFVYHDFAFLDQRPGLTTKESHWAAEAARCAADQQKFWQYHDYLFTHQGAENSGAFSKANLKRFAVALGLNQAQFNSCLDSEKHKEEVDQTTQDAQAVGVSGTPTAFINTKMLVVYNSQYNRWESVGAAPYSYFQNEIDQALK